MGGALNRGLARAGFETRVSNEGNVAEVAAAAEILILAVPYGAISDVVKQVGANADGKIVIDVTNALTEDMQLAIGFTTSGAEELQKKLPQAKVVKAFNTVFAEHMDSGKLNGQALTIFAAANDEQARSQVLAMAKAIGFDAVSAGPLQNARQLESLGYLNIHLGYVLGNGTATGFRYLH